MGAADQNSIARARTAIGERQYAIADSLASALLRDVPDHIDALEIRFLCQQALHELDAAESTLRRIILLAPGKQWPRGDLARLLLAAGRHADAEEVLRAAIASDNRHADAHAALGALLSERESLVPGAWHLQRAIDLAGRHPQLLANLGRNLMRQGKLEEAEPLLRAACVAAPDLLSPAIHLAELAEQQDQFDRAAALLDRAETIAQRQGLDVIAQRAHLLSRTTRWRDGLALLDAVPDLAGTGLLLRARIRDRAGRYDEAWTDAVTAKHQLADARGHVYDAASANSLFTNMRNLARHRIEIPVPTQKPALPQPIFILGFPRSGTTMVEQVLSSHSRIRAGGELPFASAIPALIEQWTGQPFDQATKKIARDPNLIGQVHDFYVAQARAFGLLSPGVDFFTDKMPLNEVYLPLLRIAFPEAPMIAVQRDPRDVMVSAMQHDMTHGFHCSYRLEDAARHFAAAADLTHDYRDLGLAPYTFRYERFVADQARETVRLMTAVGLAPEPAQTDFYNNRRHAPTPSYAQVREPLHGRAVGRWRKYADQLSTVEPILAQAIARGGY